MIELAKLSPEELLKEAEYRESAHLEAFNTLRERGDDLLDEDGYPTEYALELVENWHWGDVRGWFDFIKSVWWMPDWGWHEHDAEDEFFAGRYVHRINISTAGWSGNESLIHAMQKNNILWITTWVQSRRGGHYIFEFDAKTPELT